MKILIAYSSKHGTTERIAGILNVKLNGAARLFNLSRGKRPDLNNYHIVVIGASIYKGRISKAIHNYLQENEEVLLTKKLGLYLSCLEQGEKAVFQFNASFPEALRKHAFVSGILGGEAILSKMNILERWIIRNSFNIKRSTTRLNNVEINTFVTKILEQIASSTP
jgi:menaquinone-dependent protoporphyrinogen oxidase